MFINESTLSIPTRIEVDSGVVAVFLFVLAAGDIGLLGDLTLVGTTTTGFDVSVSIAWGILSLEFLLIDI
jgi:hypothetical protein